MGSCITPIAIKKNDINICLLFNELGDSSTKEISQKLCLEDYKEKTGVNWMECKKIKNQINREKCIKTLVPLENSKKLCSEIFSDCNDFEECKIQATNSFVGALEREKINKKCSGEALWSLNAIFTVILNILAP